MERRLSLDCGMGFEFCNEVESYLLHTRYMHAYIQTYINHTYTHIHYITLRYVTLRYVT